jgi:rsbT antagonist protein RsbS
MVSLGMDTGAVHTALDLEEGLAYLGGVSAQPATAARARSAQRR